MLPCFWAQKSKEWWTARAAMSLTALFVFRFSGDTSVAACKFPQTRRREAQGGPWPLWFSLGTAARLCRFPELQVVCPLARFICLAGARSVPAPLLPEPPANQRWVEGAAPREPAPPRPAPPPQPLGHSWIPDKGPRSGDGSAALFALSPWALSQQLSVPQRASPSEKSLVWLTSGRPRPLSL